MATKSSGAPKVDISKVHAVSRLLHEVVNYPGHAARKSSPEYTKVHKELTKEKDLPCLACGVKNSILQDTKTRNDPALNPHGATQMETHHHIVEWALANAIDLKKFNQRIVQHMRARPHHDPIYDKDFTPTQMLEWIDHHPDNLWVLCDVHHRGSFFGVHEITFPIWGPQDLVQDNFDYIPSKTGGVSPTAKKAMEFVPPSARRNGKGRGGRKAGKGE